MRGIAHSFPSSYGRTWMRSGPVSLGTGSPIPGWPLYFASHTSASAERNMPWTIRKRPSKYWQPSSSWPSVWTNATRRATALLGWSTNCLGSLRSPSYTYARDSDSTNSQATFPTQPFSTAIPAYAISLDALFSCSDAKEAMAPFLTNSFRPIVQPAARKTPST